MFFKSGFFEKQKQNRIFGENLVLLAQKMTELFNLGTDQQTDIWIYRAPMELKIL